MHWPTAATRKKLLPLAGLLLVYLLLIGLLYSGLITRFSQEVPYGSAGDLKFILSIVDFSIHTSLRDLYNFPMFYPESRALVRTHPLFGISVFYKLFHWLGLNLEASTNLYIIMGLLIGALGCFLFAREVSGNVPFSIVFSLLYLAHDKNQFHFVWLDFFSRFWVPLVLYFLLRFFRGGRRWHAAAAAGLAFLEFAACIYLGTLLGVFLLPAFVLGARLLGLIDRRRLLETAAWFLLALGLIAAVFYPYLMESMSGEFGTANRGLSAANLFQSRHWLRPWLGGPIIKTQSLFPGLAILACVVLFFVPRRSKRRPAVFLLLFVPVLGLSLLAYSPGVLFEALFLVWLAMLTVALARDWKEKSAAERLTAITLAFFLLVCLKFDYLPGFKSFSLYSFFYLILPPIRGLRLMNAGFIMALPLLTAMAAAGAARHFRWPGKGLRLRLVLTILVVLMLAENVYLPYVLYPGRVMRAIPRLDAAAYQSLPFRSNRVVLEIPHYFVNSARNAQYLLNWRLHRNYLINGKARLRPREYWGRLVRLIGPNQKGFPTDAQLERLLQDYSVGRVIIHWDLLRKYQGEKFDRDRTWAKIQGLKKYGRVESADGKTVVIAVQELIPVAAVIRTYSDFHLRRHPLHITLQGPVRLPVSVRINGRDAPPPRVSGNGVIIDLRHEELEKTGNRVEVRFAVPQMVDQVDLWPEETPLPF
jgi:hypothetical protein